MDKYIDGRFERLEKALANLIDSVTKYHPSIQQGEELNLADQELSRGLEEVQTHQNNYLRIQQLRESSNALDTQIRDTLSNLATTRKDIVTTQTTTFPSGPSYPIAYEELLNYARRISKTTMPPAGTIKAVPPTPDVPEVQTPGGQTPAAQTPGPESQAASVMTPSAPPSSQVQSPAIMNGTPAVSQEPAATQQSSMSANTVLPSEWTQFLNPLTDQIFLPWPNDLQLGAGSLAANQLLQEQGIDPKGYDPAEEEERKRREEEERKQKEEEDRIAQEEREKKQREERERQRIQRERQREKDQEAWRRASLVGGPAAPGEQRSPTGPPQQKAQFQFTNLDDLDDDDDDD